MSKSIYIAGIGGTFMAGVAAIAQELGYEVRGSDRVVYPPMSDQLKRLGIAWDEHYDPSALEQLATKETTTLVVGNALSRGMPWVEALMSSPLDFKSAPAFLYEAVLRTREVIAVAGTHGKTTTTALVAWLLDQLGEKPGFLIGGIPQGWDSSARLGEGRFFVIEADEYDTAFFDKRPKFLHYWPRWVIMNNLEFDHADIYDNLEMIQKQFCYLLRTVPPGGGVVYPAFQPILKEVVASAAWCRAASFGRKGMDDAEWAYALHPSQPETFELFHQQRSLGWFEVPLWGEHNIQNAVAAIAILAATGIEPTDLGPALKTFPGVRRRLEQKPDWQSALVFEDFAHHPTAIRVTLEAVRRHLPGHRMAVILALASNTMRMGQHVESLGKALEGADWLGIFSDRTLAWDAPAWRATLPFAGSYFTEPSLLKEALGHAVQVASKPWVILVLSNGSLNASFLDSAHTVG